MVCFRDSLRLVGKELLMQRREPVLEDGPTPERHYLLAASSWLPWTPANIRAASEGKEEKSLFNHGAASGSLQAGAQPSILTPRAAKTQGKRKQARHIVFTPVMEPMAWLLPC